jgi:predicted NBD/HSP70 family sugar kinase
MESVRVATRTTVRKVDGRLMQQANRAMVLNLVRSDPTLSRAAIVRRTGLSPAAVSTIVEHLLRDNLVREEGAVVTGSVGRRPQRLAFNPDARLALGIDLDVREVSAALVDLGGTTRTVHRTSVPEGLDPPAVLDLAASVARRAAEEAPASMLLGVGMAVPGMVTWPDGVNLFSPNFGWRDVPVRTLMEARLGRPVLVDNEVRALALAEHAFGAARETQTVVFLDAGYGLGGAVIIEGALYRGRHGAAAEFGHNTVEQNGPRCACGNQGCLEVFASVSGLRARVCEALAAGRASMLAEVAGDALSIERIAAAAQAGDALAGEVLGRAATYLGLAVANVVDSWDPELVVLSGPVVTAGAALFEDVLATEQRSVLETGRNRVRVARAAIQAHAKIIGAATLVIADYLAAPLLAR